ncbi:MAG: hypothetical protein ACRD0K_18840 [Egibacteraceae bacterium]
MYHAVWGAWAWGAWVRVGRRAFAEQTPVAAVSRMPDRIDLFAVGEDGGVYHAAWGGAWAWGAWAWGAWARVGRRAFAEQTPVAAVSRTPDQIDLFAVGDDGGVYHAAWGGAWGAWARVGRRAFAEQTPVAAVSRTPDQIDLFAVGAHASVYNAAWNGAWSDWLRLPLQAAV